MYRLSSVAKDGEVITVVNNVQWFSWSTKE
jgi:hypothetical protein